MIAAGEALVVDGRGVHGGRRAECTRELAAATTFEQREGVAVEIVAEIEALAPVAEHEFLHAHEARCRSLVPALERLAVHQRRASRSA